MTAYLAIYAAVAIAIFVAFKLSLRSEPTAHGQIVGAQIGFWLAVLWPLALAYFVVASPWLAWTWWKSRDER